MLKTVEIKYKACHIKVILYQTFWVAFDYSVEGYRTVTMGTEAAVTIVSSLLSEHLSLQGFS